MVCTFGSYIETYMLGLVIGFVVATGLIFWAKSKLKKHI